MPLQGTRPASHAGSWYTDDPQSLAAELDRYLEAVPETLNDQSLPVQGARAIIAPHAGYRYSGPCAAWAYKALDLRSAKRVFVLGPSHTYYLRGAALTTFAKWDTPFGAFTVDADVVAALRATGRFSDIPRTNDVREHSLEMHLPYVWTMLQELQKTAVLVPIMVGDNNAAAERALGELLLPYLADPTNAFVVSSDFCHWGSNFGSFPYCASTDWAQIRELSSRRRPAAGEPPIHEFIRKLDAAAFDAIETGDQQTFVDYLNLTDNSVCGRHPISVVMAALQLWAKKQQEDKKDDKDGNAAAAAKDGKFSFVRYERSDLANSTSDSSVSYGAAYAVC